MNTATRDYGIPGTPIFDGAMAAKGYALNRMCYSFNAPDNRAEFRRDEDAYCRRYGLTDEQRAAVASRNVLQLLAAGGNIYYLAKFAGILGLDVQDIGAQQTGMTKDAFKAMLVAQGRDAVPPGALRSQPPEEADRSLGTARRD